jgi:hypothetical protein
MQKYHTEIYGNNQTYGGIELKVPLVSLNDFRNPN